MPGNWWYKLGCRYGGVTPKALFPGDYDGDGSTDLMCTGGSFGRKWVATSDGESSFSHKGLWISGFCASNDQLGLGDFNGDSKSDLYCYDNAGQGATWSAQVALSNGSEFVNGGQWLAPAGSQRFSVGDMNGDGLTDVWWQIASPYYDTWVALSNGTSAFSDRQLWRDHWCGANGLVAGDFNGDSKTDLSCHHKWVAISGSLLGKTDVLASVQNSLGGTTTIEYVPGTQWNNTEVPPPGQISQSRSNSHSTTPSTHPMSPGGPTVSSVTVSDGRGWSKTTTYEYGGGLYDSEEREWFGFEYAKQTQPALAGESAGPYTETWFRQDIMSAGTVESQEYRDGSGNLMTSLSNEFETGGNGETEPYTAKITGRQSCTFEGAESDCFYTEYEYDAYGNRTVTKNHGYDVATGEETTSVTEFSPNTSAYIVNKVSRQVTYLGIGTTGQKLNETRYFYDQESSYTAAPSVGLLTNQSVWRNTNNTFIPLCAQTTCLEYYSDGNLKKRIDLKGGETLLDLRFIRIPEHDNEFYRARHIDGLGCVV